MEVSILDPGPNRCVKLAGEISISDAAELRDLLALALTTSSTLVLDLSELESIDTAGLQVLTAVLKEPHPVRISQASAALLRIVELIRLDLLLTACREAQISEETV